MRLIFYCLFLALILSSFELFVPQPGSTAGKQKSLFIAFYNVENLFDTIDDPATIDEEFTPGGANQWNGERLCAKLDRLAKVISTMNDEKLPDVIGLCEIENRKVCEMLASHKTLKKSKYHVVHFESPDARGIDVALLVKSKKVKVIGAFADRVSMNDSGETTRDILWVQTLCEGKDTLWFSVNHFPSRREGEAASRHKRITAANTLRLRADSILKANASARIIIMGDFNDEPADSSIYYCIGARDFSSDALFYNPMISIKQSGKGSYKYRNDWNMLDQLILSRGVVSHEHGLVYDVNSASIFSPEWLQDQDPKFHGNPFRTYAGKKYLGGYSDHFPVTMRLTVK